MKRTNPTVSTVSFCAAILVAGLCGCKGKEKVEIDNWTYHMDAESGSKFSKEIAIEADKRKRRIAESFTSSKRKPLSRPLSRPCRRPSVKLEMLWLTRPVIYRRSECSYRYELGQGRGGKFVFCNKDEIGKNQL